MIAAYGMSPMPQPLDPDEWHRQLEEQRRRLTELRPQQSQQTLSFVANPATKTDLAELRQVLESQMFALLAEVRRLADAAKPKRKPRRKAARR